MKRPNKDRSIPMPIEDTLEAYEDMMPFEVEESYVPTKARSECRVRSARKNRKHVYVAIAEKRDKLKFYVGVTGRRPASRWEEHRGEGRYSGAEFLEDKTVQTFILVAKNVRNAEEVENKVTLQLMVKYGTLDVTGGKYAVDGHPLDDLPLYSNPDEYDYLADVDEIESEPIPKSEAHHTVVNGPISIVFHAILDALLLVFKVVLTIIVWGIYLLIGLFIAFLAIGFIIEITRAIIGFIFF